MKPDFALSLSADGICLLERAGSDWVVIGEINLSDNEFDARIAELRAQGLARSPNADQVKLVIPNEQIKFYSLARPADTQTAEIEELITDSLEQETPYSISELAFDWVTSRERIFVAAVALQTLEEAENFAKQQGFTALGSVAIPPANGFIGEAFFGLSDSTQAAMEGDISEIRIAAPTVQATATPPNGTNSNSKTIILPPSQSVPNALEKNDAKEDERKEADKQQANIVFQSVRNVDLRQAEKDPADRGKSALTLIAPIDQDIPQVLANFKPQTRTNASLLNRLVNRLYGNTQTTYNSENQNRLMNAGFLPAFMLILTTVCLVGAGAFYVAKPALVQLAEQFMGPPAGPDITIELALPRDVSEPGKKLILSNKTDPSPVLAEDFLFPPVMSNSFATNENPYADLTSPRPSIDINQASISEYMFEPDLKHSEIPKAYTIDTMAPLLRTTDPSKLEPPEKYSKFQFIQEKLRSIYASSGIWSFSPKAPNSIGSATLRNVPVITGDPSVLRLQRSSLSSSTAFETDLEITGLAMSPAAGTNLNPKRTEVGASNSDATKTLDGYVTFSAAPPVLPESIPQHPNALRGPQLSISLQAVSTPLEGMATLSNPKEIASGQQTKSVGTEFAALFKPEARSPLRQLPNELSQPVIDSPTVSPTGRPLTYNRPMPRPVDSDQTVDEKAKEDILRPKSRPASIKPILPSVNEDIVATSLRPKKRPSNINPVQEIVSALTPSPEDAEGDEASVSKDALSSPNSSRVSSKATMVKVLDLRSINLIGVYLSSGKHSALIRLSSGKRVMVKVGDKLDGGKVAAISDKELRYIKRGQNITLELPTG